MAALLAAACGCGTSSSPGATSGDSSGTVKSGTPAPDFTTQDVDGKTFRLSDHLGKEVLLLDFWSTFCEPCKAEFPHLKELYAQNKAKGFFVIAISMDGPETVAEVPAFVKRYGLDFPVILDQDSRIVSLYNPRKTMPLSVLIDRSGSISVVREGYNPGDEKYVSEDVAKVLDQAAPPK